MVMNCCWFDPFGVSLDKLFRSIYSLLGLVIVRKPETKKSHSVKLLSLNPSVGFTKPKSLYYFP
jgi:hypothetical protein